MIAKVSKSDLNGKIKAVSSKSQAHRLLICSAFLSSSPVTIDGLEFSEDVTATIDCLKNLGAKIKTEKSNRRCIVYPVKKPKNHTDLNVKSSASTLRFLMPIVAITGLSADFLLSDSLKNRPMEPFINALKNIEKTADGYSVNGGSQKGKIVIDASLSSQFLSGLLLAVAIENQGREIEVTGKTVSKGYVDMTVGVLKEFGYAVTINGGIYKVDKVFSPKKTRFTVEGDWSNAAFFLVGGALSSSSVTVSGLNVNSLQKDSAIIDILREIGANVKVFGSEVTAFGGKLTPLNFAAEDTPDLVPILAVLASFIQGKSTISGVSRLKIKESNRLQEIIKMLKRAGITTETDGNTLTVYGVAPTGGTFDGANDHRIVMAATVLSLYANGKSTITCAESVDKSYPSFFKDVRLLGGKTRVYLER